MAGNGARGSETAFRGLASEVRARVVGGEFDDGSRLPTESELMEQQGLSRHTVRRALELLEGERLIVRVPGRGTFALPRTGSGSGRGTVHDLLGASEETDLEIIDPLMDRVDLTAASRLRLETGSVVSCSFRRLHDGKAYSFTTVYLPPSVAALLRDQPVLSHPGAISRTSIIALLDDRLPSPVVEAEQSIAVEELPASIAPHLPSEAGDRVLRIDKLYSDGDGRLIELAVAYYVPELYSYRIHLRRSGF